MGNIASTVQST